MEISCKMDMKTIDQLIGNLRKMLENVKVEGAAELKAIGEGIMIESALECPRDTWTLFSSGYVKEPVVTSNKVAVEIGYGGPEDKQNPKTGKMASAYMMIVHETPPDQLGGHHPVGKWKFFEDPVRRSERKFEEQLANRIRVVLTRKPGG